MILAPTRELVQQIYNEARKFAFGTIMRVGICYGGTSVAMQKQNLGRGASIIVGTLGRFAHFVNEGIITLEKVRQAIDAVPPLTSTCIPQEWMYGVVKIINKNC